MLGSITFLYDHNHIIPHQIAIGSSLWHYLSAREFLQLPILLSTKIMIKKKKTIKMNENGRLITSSFSDGRFNFF